MNVGQDIAHPVKVIAMILVVAMAMLLKEGGIGIWMMTTVILIAMWLK